MAESSIRWHGTGNPALSVAPDNERIDALQACVIRADLDALSGKRKARTRQAELEYCGCACDDAGGRIAG